MEIGLLRTRSSFGDSALIEHVSPSDSDNCDESWSNRDFCGNTRPEKLSKSSGHMIFRAINPINCWTSARKSECGKSEYHGPWSEEFTAISASNFVRYALAFLARPEWRFLYSRSLPMTNQSMKWKDVPASLFPSAERLFCSASTNSALHFRPHFPEADLQFPALRSAPHKPSPGQESVSSQLALTVPNTDDPYSCPMAQT